MNERTEAIIKLPHPITKILELPSLEVFKKKGGNGTWGHGLVENVAVLG